MKNLKKVLALVLAFACAFTMFAGAAFTDEADFNVNADTVDTLVALGVIDGYADGSFKPEGTVSRAEMAKMIYVLRTGNSDASAYNDDKSSFTDIGDHWGRGYIKYCQSLGIISGKSVTKFDPNGKVTAQEAAKMLLVTLGYDAQKAGLEGATWASKTNALADENGLLEDVNTSFTAACPRQYAAQLIYNAIFAPTVVFRDGAYTNTNYQDKDNKTIGEKYMGLKTSVGTLEGTVKESGKDTYKLNLDMSAANKEDSDMVNGKYVDSFTKVAKDYSALKNRVVKVLFKESDKVYGVFATDDSSVLNGVVGDYDVDGAKIKYDGEKYSVLSTAGVYENDADTAVKKTVVDYVENAKGALKAADAKVVLNDDDKVERFDVTTFMVGKVSYVGKDYVNVVYKGGDTVGHFSNYAKLDKDSCNSDISDLKKDDYIIITNSMVNEKLDAVKADMVEGKIESTRDSGDEIRIDGTWYKSALDKNDDIKLSNEVSVVLKNGYVAFVDDVKAGSNDVALMIEAAKNSGVGAKWQADLLFADGTRKVVDVDDDKENSKFKSDILEGVATDKVTGVPFLVTYDQSGSKYELDKVVTSSNQAGYDKVTNVADKSKVDDGKLLNENGKLVATIDDSAAIFLKYGDDDYKVVTGADMKKWSDKNLLKGHMILTDMKNGYENVKVGFIETDKNPSGSDKSYAYIFGIENNAKDEDHNEYVEYNVFNGTDATTLKVKHSAANAYAEGTVVEYTLDSDGYADCTVYGKDKLTADALAAKAWDGKGFDGDIKLGTTTTLNTYKIDKDDTMVLFINTDDKTGVAEFEPMTAIEIFDNSGKVTGYKKNVAYYSKDGKTIDVLVIDITNEIKASLFD